MKKFFSLMLVAMVMLVAACEQNVEIDTPKSEGLSFYAEIAMTRADLEQGTDSKWTTVWEGNETLDVNGFEFENTVAEPSKFSCTADGVTELVGKTVTITMDSDSVPATGKGIMIETEIAEFDPTTTITLDAKNAFFRFTYTGDAEFTLSEPLFVVDGAVANTITVAASGDTWVSVLPGTATLTFKGDTNGETKTKENFNIVAGKIYNLGTLTDDTVYVYKPITSLVDLTDGDYIITGLADDDSYYALPSTTTVTSNKINGETVTVTDGVVVSDEATGKVWSIKKDGDGYTISNGSKYLNYITSTNIGVIDESYSWTPSYDSQGWLFVASTTSTLDTVRALLFQSGSTNRFGGYAVSNATATGYSKIQLFKKMAENEEPYKTPIIATDITEKSVDVNGLVDFYITATATNFDVNNISVTSDVEWLKVEHEGDGAILVNVEANSTSSVREGHVTISYEGASDVEVTFTQAGNAVPVTIAEFLAAEEDSTLYELSGTIINVSNSTYGNFTIMDDTGKVYIYGLYDENGEVAWTKSGAKIGDDITIKTIRSSYNGVAQGANSTCVDVVSPGTRAFWTFDKTAVTLSAAANSSATVTVEAYNLVDTVNVTSNNEQFTPSYADGVLTITAMENTTARDIIGNITVTSGTLSQIITVTQAAQSTESTYTKITSATELTDGEYIIVYEDDSKAYVFNGKDAANGYSEGTISDNTITGTFDGEVTISAMEGGYSLKVAAGYMSGTSGSNKLNFNVSTAQLNTITFNEDGTAHIVSNSSVMRFNSASDNMRFRYFKNTTYTGQKAVYLYKKN